jgi:hypothetical protein
LQTYRPDKTSTRDGAGNDGDGKLLTPFKNDRFYDGLAGGIREPLKFGEDVLLVPREVTDDTRIAKQLSDVSVGECETVHGTGLAPSKIRTSRVGASFP